MSFAPRIAIFDVDGTILKKDSLIFSDKIKSSFEKLHQKEIKIAIATARDFVSMLDFCGQLKYVDYLIGANGAFLWDFQKQDYLYNNFLNKDEVKLLFEELSEIFQGIIVLSKDYAYASETFNKKHWYFAPFAEKIKLYNHKEIAKEDLFFIEIRDDYFLDKKSFLDEFFKKHNLNLTLSSFWNRGAFISNRNVSKGIAIKNLLSSLGFQSQSVISFGDGHNDLDMLSLAGYAVAMGNSSDEVKKIANLVTKSVEEDGVYFALKDLKII